MDTSSGGVIVHTCKMEVDAPGTSTDIVKSDADSPNDTANDDDKGPPEKKNKPARKQLFNYKLLSDPEIGTWVKPLKDDPYRASCIACSSVLLAGRSRLLKHKNTSMHGDNYRILEASGRAQKLKNIDELPAFEITKEKKIAELSYVMDIVENNKSFISVGPQPKMFRVNHPDCKEDHPMSLNRTKIGKIVENVLNKSIIQEYKTLLRDKVYSILLEESPDILTTKNLCVLLRFIHEDEVRNYLLNYVPINEITAEDLYKCLLRCLKEHNLSVANMIGICASNTHVLLDERNSVVNRLLQDNSEILVLPAVHNAMHFVASKASKQLPRIVTKLLYKFCCYFSRSPKRQSIFNNGENIVSDEKFKILPLMESNWLEVNKCIDMILKQWNELFGFFSEAMCKKNYLDIVQDIFDGMTYPYTRIYLLFLKYALKPFSIFARHFENTENMSYILLNACHSLLNMLGGNFLRPDVLKNEDFCNIDVFDDKNILPLEQIYIGSNAQDMLDSMRNTVDNSEIQEIYENCLSFYQKAYVEAIKRFALKDPVVQSLDFLCPSVALDISKHRYQIDHLLEKFPSRFNREKVKDQWHILALYYIGNEKREMLRLSCKEFWREIIKILDPDTNEPLFKDIVQMAHFCMSLPPSNRDAKRIFSLVNDMQTKQRANLRSDMIAALCRIKTDLEYKATKSSKFIVTEDMLSLFNADMYATKGDQQELSSNVKSTISTDKEPDIETISES